MIAVALWIIVKVSIVIGVAAIVQAPLHRRASAAMRHLVWTLAIVGVLVLPILSLVLPQWAVITTSTPIVADEANVVVSVEQPAASISPATSLERSNESAPTTPSVVSNAAGLISAVYAAGLVVMLILITVQRQRVRRLVREASDVDDREWKRRLQAAAASIGVQRPVRLLRSRECSMPLAVGIVRPAIVLPAMSDTWPEDRRRAVLLHELAHVARHDCFTQSLALMACIIYWFHPAAWLVACQLRIERELAYDDRVITAGAEGRDYASHLLEIAYSLGRRRAPALAVTMARPRQLEGRMLAALDVARKRSIRARIYRRRLDRRRDVAAAGERHIRRGCDRA